MKKSLILVGMLVIGYANAQEGTVGINTSNPKATLDIQPNATNLAGTTNEGILAPRLSKERIANIATPVEGTLVYATDNTYTGANTKVSKINEKGYYFYNGTEWVKASTGNALSSNIYTADGTLNGERNVNINNTRLNFHNGEVVNHNANGFRIAQEKRDIIFRNDGDSFWLLTTNENDKLGNWNDARPFQYNFSSKKLILNELDGNVGIGTGSPGRKLHVAGNTQIGNYDEGKPGSLILDANTAEEGGHITLSKDRTYGTQDWHIDQIGSDTAGYSRFRIFPGTEQNNGISILENGNMGVGTNSPELKLHVAGGDVLAEGSGQVNAYIGGDGVGNDVELGSIKAGVTDITLYNRVDRTPMNLVSGNISARGEIKASTLSGDGDKIVIANNDGTLTKGGSISNFATSNIYTADGTLNAERNVNINTRLNFHNGEVVNHSANGFRIAHGERGAFFRNDGNDFWLLATEANDKLGMWSDARPFSYNFSSKNVIMNHHAGDGNVGIGTASPGRKLHVAGNTQIGSYDEGKPGSLILDAVTAEEGGHITLSKDRTFGTKDWIIDQIGNGGNVGVANPRFRIFSGTEENNGISILENGYVGVGTSSPKAKLDVSGHLRVHNSNDHMLRLQKVGDDKVTDLIKRADGTFVISNGNAATNVWDEGRISITSTNVGIGTETPTEKLDVAGSIKSRDLAGTGNRNVVADANGKLVIGEVTTPIRTETTSTTLTAADNNGYVYVDAAGATTVTIPATLPAGFSCIIVQQGAGQVTIAGNGVTLQTARGTKTRARYSAVGIIKRTADTATITGDAVN